MHLKISAKRLAKRRYTNDQEIHVTDLDTGSVGYLPARSLIRNERSGRPQYKILFEASTDNGRTWTNCASNDTFMTFKA